MKWVIAIALAATAAPGNEGFTAAAGIFTPAATPAAETVTPAPAAPQAALGPQ